MNFNSTLTLNRLIKECLDGNRVSQKELYDKYSPKLFPLCLHNSPNIHKAQDALIVTFVYIFNNLSEYRINTSFEDWINQVTVDILKDANKKHNVLIPSSI